MEARPGEPWCYRAESLVVQKRLRLGALRTWNERMGIRCLGCAGHGRRACGESGPRAETLQAVRRALSSACTGGVAPSAGGDYVGQLRYVPYTAEYYFYRVD